MNFNQKKVVQQRRRLRIRKGILGTEARPRLSLYFSGKHIYAQCIDDCRGHTIVYLSTVSKALEGHQANVEGAVVFGKLFGEAALKAGVKDVVFDRGIRKYHGKVKGFADSVRNAGVRF